MLAAMSILFLSRLGPGLTLWMDETLNHFETMVETIVRWNLQGNHHSRASLVRNGFRPSTASTVWWAGFRPSTVGFTFAWTRRRPLLVVAAGVGRSVLRIWLLAAKGVAAVLRVEADLGLALRVLPAPGQVPGLRVETQKPTAQS